MSTVCVLQQPSDDGASPQTMKIPSSSSDAKEDPPTPTKMNNNMMMFSVISPRDSPIPLKQQSSLSNSAPSYLSPRLPSSCSGDGSDNNNNEQRNNSYYSVPNNIIQKHGPLRSSMSSRTLHESLHRGRRSSSASQDNIISEDNDNDGSSSSMMKRSVSFSQVNIREYERVRGPKNSSTLGPPLSIGWRYAEELISLNIDEYENNKGPRRCSAEFLVPKHVRERILKEHTAAAAQDNNNGKKGENNVVVDISSHRATRRRSSTTFPTAATTNVLIEEDDDNSIEEGEGNSKKDKAFKKVTMKSSLHKLKKILKPTSLARIPPYEEREAKLWNDAHIIAIEKAKKLEESIKRGENISCIDLYSVGTPCNNILPSLRNSVNIPLESEARMVKNSLLMDDGDNQSSGGGGQKMESRRVSAPAEYREIVVTEDDGGDEELRLAKLLSDDAAI